LDKVFGTWINRFKIVSQGDGYDILWRTNSLSHHSCVVVSPSVSGFYRVFFSKLEGFAWMQISVLLRFSVMFFPQHVLLWIWFQIVSISFSNTAFWISRAQSLKRGVHYGSGWSELSPIMRAPQSSRFEIGANSSIDLFCDWSRLHTERIPFMPW
jgi:hypothetical protein